MADTPAFTLTDAPSAADLDVLQSFLMQANEALVGPSGRRALAIFVRDTDGTMRAGLSGFTGWGWLFIQWLWVAQESRGDGLGRRLITMAEDEARVRGCRGAHIDTFNPAALELYQTMGYRPFGALEDFPVGWTRTWLSKPL